MAWERAAGSASDFLSLPRHIGFIRLARSGRGPYEFAAFGEGIKILVVDDNRDTAEVMAEALRLRDYQVENAESAEMALTLLSDFQPDIAILDIGLPDIDGYETGKGNPGQDGETITSIDLR